MTPAEDGGVLDIDEVVDNEDDDIVVGVLDVDTNSLD
jgi:hypothetical protein